MAWRGQLIIYFLHFLSILHSTFPILCRPKVLRSFPIHVTLQLVAKFLPRISEIPGGFRRCLLVLSLNGLLQKRLDWETIMTKANRYCGDLANRLARYVAEDGSNMDVWNVDILPQHCTTPQPRRPRLETVIFVYHLEVKTLFYCFNCLWSLVNVYEE